MTPAIIKKFVTMYINTISVLMQAIRSASMFELPDFSPNALAHMRQLFIVFPTRLGIDVLVGSMCLSSQ